MVELSKPYRPPSGVQNFQRTNKKNKKATLGKSPVLPMSQTPTVGSMQPGGLEFINLISWNINSLAKTDSLTGIFGSLHGQQPNIICFQETLLTKQDADYFKMNGFKPFFFPAASHKPNKGENRGLLTAVSLDLIAEYAPVNDSLRMGNGIETLSVRVYGKTGHITIHNTYVHHESSPLSINLQVGQGKHAIVGDFNARHPDWEPSSNKISQGSSSERGKALHALILNTADLVLANTPSVPTTFTNSTLTLSLVSAELAAGTSWEVIQDCLSDRHMATLTKIQFDPPTNHLSFTPRFIYSKADWKKLGELTDKPITPPESEQIVSMENKLTTFVDAAFRAASKSIPTTKPHDKIPPWECWWFDDNCKEAKKKLHSAVQSCLRKETNSRANLRRTRAATLNVYATAKHEAFNEICQDLNLGTPIASQWKRLRWLYNGGTPPKPSLIADAQARANESMALFSDRSKSHNLTPVAQILQERLFNIRTGKIEEAIGDKSATDTPFTITELNEALAPVKKSAPGNDAISYMILSHLGPAFRYELLELINLSWHMKKLPTQWKLVPIIPVPKRDPGEFRPIALLSCIDKIMERMVLARLKFQVGPLHPSLVGCTQGRGTTDAIATLAKLASDARHGRSGPTTNSLLHCFALFVDYKQAFELANSTTILHILSTDKKVQGNMLAWLQDYLSSRRGYTTVQNSVSDPLEFENGTPQGSILSPFLFNILIDKLLRIIEDSLGKELSHKVTIVAYADDLVIMSNHIHAPVLLNKAIDMLELASNILGLRINVQKTKAMAWTHSRFFPPFQFEVYGKPIEWVREFRYLGVIFDDQLSFIPHARAIAKAATKRINILKHMAGSPYGASQKTLLTYVKMCIRPVLEYGNIILPIARVSATRVLETLFNISLKIALRLPKCTPTYLVLAEAGVTSLVDRSEALAAVAITKINAYPNSHPFFHTKKEMHMDRYLMKKASTLKNDVPLDIALSQLITKFTLPTIKHVNIPLRCPFSAKQNSQINMVINPLHLPKHQILSTQFETIRLDIENHLQTNYPDHQHIYVDGSVDPDSGRAGAAFIFKPRDSQPILQSNFRLSDWVSSTQAELSAILKSLVQIGDIPSPRHALIMCDSMAAMHSLQKTDPDPLDSLVFDILQVANDLYLHKKIHITVYWIPSHMGIEFNEMVDQSAKDASQKCEIDLVVPPTIGQVKSYIKRHQKARFKLEFQNLATENTTVRAPTSTITNLAQQYLSVNPSLAGQQQITTCPNLQRDINRLRMDADKWCYQHKSSMRCSYCELPFSSSHYLLTCPATASHSHEIMQCLTPSEHDLTFKDMSSVILRKLSTTVNASPLCALIKRYPIRIYCEFPEHGDIPYFFSTIPTGL